MRALRVVLAVALMAAALSVIVLRIVPRLHCNLEKGRINAEIRSLLRSGMDERRRLRALRNVEACRRCVELYPQDYEMFILLGLNERALGRRDEALQTLRSALALCERPEIYTYMAIIELQQGNIAAARAHLLKAALFSVNFTAAVDDPLRTEVYKAAMDRHERLRGRRER